VHVTAVLMDPRTPGILSEDRRAPPSQNHRDECVGFSGDQNFAISSVTARCGLARQCHRPGGSPLILIGSNTLLPALA